MGVFHSKGRWPKTSCPHSKVCLPWVSKRGIRDVPGILPGCPGPLAVFKNFVQKKFMRIFRSLQKACQGNRLAIPAIAWAVFWNGQRDCKPPKPEQHPLRASIPQHMDPSKSSKLLQANPQGALTCQSMSPKACESGRAWKREMEEVSKQGSTPTPWARGGSARPNQKKGALELRKRPPPTGVKMAKIGKRGFRGQKTPISQCPRNGCFESKIPISLQGSTWKMGIF